MPWYLYEPEPQKADKVDERTEAEQRVAAMAAALIAGEAGKEPWRQLLVDLLEFHRRESKPAWWAVFSRQDLPHAELLEDAECLAGLEHCPEIQPRQDKRSMIYTFRFPPQDFKLKPGDQPRRAGSLEPAGEVVAIDEDAHTIDLKLGASRSPIEPGTALIPSGPVGDRPLREAVYRVAAAVRDGEADRYAAVVSILHRDLTRLADRPAGPPVIPDGAETLVRTISALLMLDGNSLLVQGPPGAGKTYTSSQAIVALLAKEKRIGIASHSHKAIHQLHGQVDDLATPTALSIRGTKKSSREDHQLHRQSAV